MSLRRPPLRSLLAALGLLLLGAPEGSAYLTKFEGVNLVRWKAGSPAPWNDATKTLSWSLNTTGFQPAHWPSIAEAGAAFQNAFQSFEDVTGATLKFNRLPNTTGAPGTDDGQVEMLLALDSTNDSFGMNMFGAFARTYWSWNNATGAMSDADIVFNGDVDDFSWSTAVPAPNGTNDIEVTQIHEAVHGIGGGHPVYFFAAVWPTGRFPEIVLPDRCLAPDDRNLLRTLYPEAAGQGGTINGQVNLSSGGGCELAIVVATDANGVPQATMTTDASGAYSITVPAGNYTLTAHHNINLRYNSDINFGPADGFTTATTVTANGVADGNTVVAPVITATTGTPTMELSRLAVSPSALQTQVQFLAKGAVGTLQLEVGGATFTSMQISNVDLGPGIVAGLPTAVGGVGLTLVSIPFNVDAGAAPGVRTISITANGERALLPSGLMILESGTLAVAAGGANPPAAGSAPGSLDRPLLQVDLSAGATEDVRIRRLQFTLAGTGPALADVQLWRDVNDNGAVDGGDLPVFSGNAYSMTPIGESFAVAPPATVDFNNLALSVLAGTTVTLLLTADFPGAGTGDYTASLATSAVVAHGMFYGSVITPTGATVTGGAQTLGALAVAGLQQIRTTGGTAIAAGGITTETQVTLRGTVTSATGTVGLDVEVRPLGTPFTNAPTSSSATTFASGTQISLNVTGLAAATAYHWQARPTGSILAPGAWASFGGNAETASDFAVDTSTTSVPTALGQFEASGAPAVPLGGTTRQSIRLAASNGTNSGGQQVALEAEVRPAGVAFSDTPTHASAFGPGGAATFILFAGGTGDYHWQVRTVNPLGGASAWVAFDAAALHFHLDSPEPIEASAGCAGRIAGEAGLWMPALALALLLLSRLPRRAGRGAAALLLVAALGATAVADEPASFEPTAAKPLQSWGTFGAYIGLEFIDTDFEATGTDTFVREVSGSGTFTLGFEGLIDLHQNWRIGAALEIGIWEDVRLLGLGPELAFRFAASHENSMTGRADLEHWLKIGALYRRLEVDKSGFGDFDATLGFRLGYDLRVAVAERWAVQIGAELRHSVWDYAEDITAGDDELGGASFFLSVGLAWLP